MSVATNPSLAQFPASPQSVAEGSVAELIVVVVAVETTIHRPMAVERTNERTKKNRLAASREHQRQDRILYPIWQVVASVTEYPSSPARAAAEEENPLTLLLQRHVGLCEVGRENAEGGR